MLKQFVGNLPTNFLGVFYHFVDLAIKGLTHLWLRPPNLYHPKIPDNQKFQGVFGGYVWVKAK